MSIWVNFIWYWLFMIVIIKIKMHQISLMNTGGTGRRANSRMWLSCILSYQVPYLQHTEVVHQSIIIIINHYFPPSKMLKLFNSIHAKLTNLKNSEGVKYEKTISIIAFYHMLLICWSGLGWHHRILWQACLRSLTVIHAHTYARNWKQPFRNQQNSVSIN